jgi:hypothetical protein
MNDYTKALLSIWNLKAYNYQSHHGSPIKQLGLLEDALAIFLISIGKPIIVAIVAILLMLTSPVSALFVSYFQKKIAESDEVSPEDTVLGL